VNRTYLPAFSSRPPGSLLSSRTIARYKSSQIDSRQCTKSGAEHYCGKGFFVAQKRQVYSRAERLRRLHQALDAFVHEAVCLDFAADEILQAVSQKLAGLDLQPKPAGEKA